MLKSGEIVAVKWNGMNKKYYEAKGYKFTKNGDELIIKVEDLQPSSRVKVKVICDYCGEEIEVFMYAYTRSTKNSDKYACTKCKTNKTKETMLAVYGVENCTQLIEIREKQRKTLMERYGVQRPCDLPQRKEAMKHYDKEASKEKYMQTCLERYGVANSMYLPSVVEKMKRTCVERYGGESSQCSEEVHRKTIDSLHKNEHEVVSKPERAMVQSLIELYGEENCFPQYNFGKCAFDCLLTVGEVQIDVEFDGRYWHNLNSERDKRRDFYVMRRGIKVLRFKGDSEPPNKELIKENVDYLVNSKHYHKIVDI